MHAHSLTLPPAARVEGVVVPPGSKSISNRVLPMAAVAAGTTRIRNLPAGDDVGHMRKALSALGVRMSERGAALVVEGLGGALDAETPVRLFLGNSGTCMRFLAAMLCGGRGEFTLDGVERMRERPIGDLVDALLPLAGDTRIMYAARPGYPPLEIRAAGLRGGETSLRGDISSQFLTGMLMALPFCREPAEVSVSGSLVSRPYVELTLALMERFGIGLEHEDLRAFSCPRAQTYQAVADFFVEPDASSASYFLAAGAIAGEVRVEGLGPGSLQGESGFARVLARMGAEVSFEEDAITVRKGRLRGIDADMDGMSDTGMTLAVTALFAEGTTVIRNVGNWRVKETDRLSAMAAELRKLGAGVEEGEHSLAVHPPGRLLPAAINTYDDHRMAMCFSLACLGGVPVSILDPGCTSKTYPGYFEDFERLLRTG